MNIPEKWATVHEMCKEFLAHPGEPSTKPIDWCVSLIEENATLCDELQTTEATRQLATKGLHEYLAEIGRLHAENFSLRAALARMQAPVTDAKIQAQFPGAAWPEEVEKLRDGYNALIAARAAGKGNDAGR